jgi:anti-anti-sigma factor
VASDFPDFIKGLFPMAFQVKIAEENDMVILALEGKMDTASTDELSLGLEEVKRRGKKKIILLFKALEQIDDQGVALLSSFLKWAERVDRRVSLAEVQPEVLKVLTFEGSNNVYDSLVDAMKSYRRNEEMGMREERGEDGFEGRLHSEGSRMPLLVIAGGIFVFFILIIIYMTRDSSSGIEELQKKVALLEERMTQAGGQAKNVSAIQEKIEGLRKDVSEKTRQLESDLAKLRQDMESASAKAVPTTRPPVAQPPKVVKHHTVMQGETLFSISKKYGIGVDELRRLNNLKPNQTIGVGQKLVVGSS